MKKDVWVSIHSVQQFDGCEPEEINLVTGARLYLRGGKYYISYDETELTGLEGTKTTVKMDGDFVSLIRSGTYPSHMLFQKDRRHVGLYHTPAGASVTVALHTSNIQNTIGANGGELLIDYTLEMDNSLMGCHHLEMKVETGGVSEPMLNLKENMESEL